jgi:predicted chitinase
LTNDLGKLARLDDVTRLTQAINGGLNGLQERAGLTAEYKRKLGI